MTLEQIKQAVREGKKVYWSNTAYEVVNPKGGSQWLIHCTLNGSCIGLTWQDGITMNGDPKQFFIGDK